MSFAGPNGHYRDMKALPEPSTIALMITGPIAPAEVSELCERIRALLERSDADLVVCDVRSIVRPDASTVDALARLQLTARRLGRRVRLRNAGEGLHELLALMGLSDVVPVFAGLPVEAERHIEDREQVRRVEEEADPGDPAV
jgi:ABC-type transporter Mla MlaB component